jgi:hypothetical protein
MRHIQLIMDDDASGDIKRATVDPQIFDGFIKSQP